MTARFSPKCTDQRSNEPVSRECEVLHRGVRDIVVHTGNTSVTAKEVRLLGGWSPVEVFHFPIRGFRHFERKFLAHYETVTERRRGDHRRASGRSGRLGELYEGDLRMTRAAASRTHRRVDRRYPVCATLYVSSPETPFPRTAVSDGTRCRTRATRRRRGAPRGRAGTTATSDRRRWPNTWPSYKGAQGVGEPRGRARRVNLVETLVVRDEADIVDDQIAYHLNAGVDFVIATDHESVDGGPTSSSSTYATGAFGALRSQARCRMGRGAPAWRGSLRVSTARTGSSTPTPTSSGCPGAER